LLWWNDDLSEMAEAVSEMAEARDGDSRAAVGGTYNVNNNNR
jgi:hypothetical protein